MAASDVGLRSERGPILLALMVTSGLVAIEATILATAVPSIVDDLGGFAEFPWLFSVYLLAQAVSVPVYAKLSDTLGRKPVILFGIGVFLVASILCGIAWSMPALIAFRALQGLGAGAVLPMAITIAGDIYTVAERAKTQGYLASVWAVSSVVGPTLGGVFSEFLSWRWIFFVNLPLGTLAIWLLVANFREKIVRQRHKVDYLGSLLLMVSLSLLILAALEGGQAWAWNSWQSIGAFTVGGVLLAAFVAVERRAAEPVLPLGIFRRRLILTTTLISLGVGAMLMGITSYVPTYLEGTIGVSPLVSGLALAALTLGWPISATLSGRLYLNIGFRSTALVGMVVVVGATLLLAATASSPAVATVAIACFLTGLGLGLVATPTLIAAQSSVPWSERGVVTGTNMFSRSVGSAVGVAIFGALANAIFARSASEFPPPELVESASGVVFTAVAICAVATIAATFALPNGHTEHVAGAPEAAASEG
jgi:EmrB/QacA subfamily drug resistance transporter